ncbi:MAG: hypothetical protein K0R51_326 [Cytophagaceae bacterium]|jgi:hypothetical protein|nr:hypothetical protein [Cytophagaceae bacterium]
MKKLFTLFTLLLVISFTAQAQRTSIGITGGFGHSWYSYVGDKAFNPAFNGGLTFTYSSTQHWAVGIDAKFSREGLKVERDGNTFTSSLDYIRIPVRVSYFLNDYTHNIRPKFTLAPTLGIAIGANETFENEDGDKFSQDVTDEVNAIDLGASAAFGVNFRLSPKVWLTTDLVYYNGFMNVYKDTEDGEFTANRNVSFNIGLTYGIGKE